MDKNMLMDFYELTMSNVYILDGKKDTTVVFDLFYRSNPDKASFSVFAGLHSVIEYIENLTFTKSDIDFFRKKGGLSEELLDFLSNFKFNGKLKAVPEGTIVYPNTPLITVICPLIEAQIIETAMLNSVNYQTLIATKANRMVTAAAGIPIMEMGARRAQEGEAAIMGAYASYIGGVSSTSNVAAEKKFGVPSKGTMAHSFIQLYNDDYLAFKKYAEIYPDDCIFLVDTFDVLKSGIPNAIKVAKEILIPNGHRLKGIRLDSGDLAYLSKKVRELLDEAGLEDCQIVVSNSLDEETMVSLKQQGAKIDSYGVGERLITSKSSPVFGGVYKLVAVEEDGKFVSRIKISETIEKITNPGIKKLYRVYDENGHVLADLLALNDEVIETNKPLPYMYETKPWKTNMQFENYTIKELQQEIFVNGKLVYKIPSVEEVRNYVKYQIDNEIWETEQRLVNPSLHYIDFTHAFYNEKLRLLEERK